MKKEKIQPKRLIASVLNGWWGERELNVFRWILQTGKDLDTRTDGMHSVLYNYSAYNHNSFHGFYRGSKSYAEGYTNPVHTLLVGFNKAFIYETHANSVLSKWRRQERVSLDGYRMLSFPDDKPEKRSDEARNLGYDIRWEIWRVKSLTGSKLKPEMCHPDFPKRKNPFIKSIDFSAFAEGFCVRLEFTFEGKDFQGNGWDHNFYQKKDESTNRFFWRVNKQITDKWLKT